MRAPLTLAGAQRLRSELEELKSVKRPAVIAAIAEARSHGDLKENAEYHAAREQQGFIEGRIQQLESELSHADVIDVARLDDRRQSVPLGEVQILGSEGGQRRFRHREAAAQVDQRELREPVVERLQGAHH